MKSYKIINSFVSTEGPKKARDNRTDINLMIFILIFAKNCLYYDAIHDFSVWMRTGSKPADINRVRVHTGKQSI